MRYERASFNQSLLRLVCGLVDEHRYLAKLVAGLRDLPFQLGHPVVRGAPREGANG
jgi:hypothetical protein